MKETLFGHKDNISFFEMVIGNDSLNHAYLFYGDSEIGKFHFTKHLAYFLEYGEFKITNKPLIDTVFIQSGENGSVGIDEVRDLKSYMNQRPFNAKKRLVVVDDAERLTQEAQNSFLKFLEEPPEHLVFIFIVSNPESLLSTVVSRMTKLYFRRQSQEDIKNVLIKEMDMPEDKADEIASLSFGRIGRAINLLDTQKKEADSDLKEDIEDYILNLYIESKIDNSSRIERLLKKEQDIYTYNLNENLQRKAVEEIIRARI